MNYESHYFKLMERARTRLLEGYSEQHHVVPRCLGGDDSVDNLVDLTAKEHYVAHQLLVKMHPGNSKLVYAAHMMGNTRKGSRSYSWLREQHAENLRGTKHSEETKAKMSLARKGIKKSDDWKAKIGAAHKGMKRPEGTGEKISAAITGFKHSDETRAKMSEYHTGRPKEWLRGRPANNMKKIMIDNVIYESRTHAAKELSKDRSTIYNWIRSGKATEVA